jgi:hypothetical protein
MHPRHYRGSCRRATSSHRSQCHLRGDRLWIGLAERTDPCYGVAHMESHRESWKWPRRDSGRQRRRWCIGRSDRRWGRPGMLSKLGRKWSLPAVRCDGSGRRKVARDTQVGRVAARFVRPRCVPSGPGWSVGVLGSRLAGEIRHASRTTQSHLPHRRHGVWTVCTAFPADRCCGVMNPGVTP